jgi:uncharacterized protein
MIIAAMGAVSALWRYPVKSLGGETIERADFNSRGVHGDRLWAVRDVERDITASARRIPKLLNCYRPLLRTGSAHSGSGRCTRH